MERTLSSPKIQGKPALGVIEVVLVSTWLMKSTTDKASCHQGCNCRGASHCQKPKSFLSLPAHPHQGMELSVLADPHLPALLGCDGRKMLEAGSELTPQLDDVPLKEKTRVN